MPMTKARKEVQRIKRLNKKALKAIDKTFNTELNTTLRASKKRSKRRSSKTRVNAKGMGLPLSRHDRWISDVDLGIETKVISVKLISV